MIPYHAARENCRFDIAFRPLPDAGKPARALIGRALLAGFGDFDILSVQSA
jgi:hypothetical protein